MGGVELHLGDHFEIKNMGGEAYVASPGGAKMITIGKMKPSLKGYVYYRKRTWKRFRIGLL